jgi:hypothetical protein
MVHLTWKTFESSNASLNGPYAMWERGEKLPSQRPTSIMRCPCGELFDSHRLEHTMIHAPITEHQREVRR